MRHYSKLLELRAWTIVRRPIWAVIVFIGALYTFLQVVARVQAERLVKMFDALHQWDPFYEWWYVPLAVIVVGVLIKAGYELWKEEAQARKEAEAQTQTAEQEIRRLREGNERLTAKIDALGKQLQASKTRIAPPTSIGISVSPNAEHADISRNKTKGQDRGLDIRGKYKKLIAEENEADTEEREKPDGGEDPEEKNA